jgi:hypothetical protein
MVKIAVKSNTIDDDPFLNMVLKHESLHALGLGHTTRRKDRSYITDNFIAMSSLHLGLPQEKRWFTTCTTATFVKYFLSTAAANGHTLQRNPIYVFPEKELRGLSLNFHIHVSMSDLYISRIHPHIFLQQNRQTDCGNK